MATYKVALALLLLYGAISLQATSGKACPLYCLDVEYMTCQSSGDEKLNPSCNCCLAPKNCTLHLSDGTSLFCKPN
ncbi:proteinase inhibitor type-2 [Ricinus communis]|uniref:Serine-type endopeptidase inhibitor, putative n=1 Tax=Ricinus communis TaxID=3988 RepID=B9S759_RICCO|nr:proteinase inhibitor type-2 [Ricinus communis]EEF40638.1 serine-type endopeptidase inhibitor, putative [Ricinus communis]|eukprot:XP_002521828.1 proteinase inhibitor type-2 [Ricinus communis]